MGTFEKRLTRHLEHCGLELQDLKALPRLRARYPGKSLHSTFSNWKAGREISQEARMLIAADLEMSAEWVRDGVAFHPDPRRTLALIYKYRHGETPPVAVPSSPSAAPPPKPPVDFRDRLSVSPSDFALLEDIKTAMHSPELAKRVKEILAEVEGLKAIAAKLYPTQAQDGKPARKRGVRGTSVLAELDETPEADKPRKSGGGQG